MVEEKQEKKNIANDTMYSMVISIMINTVLFAIFLYGIYLIRYNWGSVDLSDWWIFLNNYGKQTSGCTPNICPDITEMFKRIYENLIHPILNEMIMVICNIVLCLMYNIPRFLCVKRKQLTYSWKWYLATLVVPVILVYIGISGIYLCYYLFVYLQ